MALENEEKKVNEETNEELPSKRIDIKELKNKLANRNFFYKAFWNHLKESKLFALSFIVVIVFLTFSFIRGVQSDEPTESKGKDEPVVYVEDENGNTKDSIVSDNISLKDYVGIYSRELTLDNPLTLTDACKVESYKIVYRVTNKNRIEKYFYSPCIGTVKLWEDGVSYQEDGGVRFISSNGVYFRFLGDSIREIKEDKNYKFEMDYSFSKIEEKVTLDDKINMYFYGENVVFLKNDNLLLLSDGKIVFDANEEYINNGGNFDTRFYKSKSKYQFNFIVFDNKENVSCYDETEESDIFSDGLLYKIYSVSYNIETGKFDDVEVLVERNKLNSCKFSNDDMKLLRK